MSELKIFKDMEANCANCPFDITEEEIKRCYDDCGDKPNECYECSYLEYYLKSEADKVLAEKDRDITILQESLQSAESVSSYRKRTIKEYEGKVDKMRTDISEKDTYISNLKNDIAEKDAEIQKWKVARDGCEQQFQAQVEETGKYLSQVLELKYKRCLDKAKWCDERISLYTLQQEIQGISWQKEIKFYRRLKDKYIEISNRFKGDA